MLGRILATLSVVLFVGAWSPALALPVLRLVVPPQLQQNNGEPQPVWITTGTDGPTDLFFEAVNDGDGTFALAVSASNAPWLLPEVTGTAPCTFDGGRTCTVIAVRFAAAGLSPGAYDGQVEVRDPTAIDSPQRVGIRTYVGTNVPDAVTLFVPPTIGVNDRVEFETMGGLMGGPAPMVTTTSPANFLVSASSPFDRMIRKHVVIGHYRQELPVGAHAGSFTVSNSTFGPDNKNVPVTLNVTNEPIADASSDRLEFFTSEDVAEQHGGVIRTIVVSNRGNGDLLVDSVDVTTDSGGDWLSIENLGGNAFVARADNTGLTAGLYTGKLTMNSNAANGPTEVVVAFQVLPAGAPELNFRGAVNGASFSGAQPLGPGAIGTVFGVFLSGTTSSADALPLPTELGGVKVLVNGIPAPLFFTAYSQINFQVPFEIQPSPEPLTIHVMRDAQMSSPISATLDVRSPGIFLIGVGQYGIITNFTQGNFPYPPEVGAALGVPAAPAQGGDFLVIWCTGLSSVTPAVVSGEAASGSPLSVADSSPRVSFGLPIFSAPVEPSFVGLAPGFVGLFQVNFQLPAVVGVNDHFPVTLRFSDARSSNTVEIAVQ